MHDTVPGKPADTYLELCKHKYGDNFGLYIWMPQQLIVGVGVNIVYMVIGAKSLMKFHDVVCKDNCKDINLTYFIMIFASAHFVISHLPKIKSISAVSLATSIISCSSFCTIAWTASLKKGVQPDVQYGYKPNSTAGTVLDFFSALGYVAFLYTGHKTVLDIQTNIPSTTEKPSKVSMWRIVIVGYIVVAIFYFPVALIGYWMYGNGVSDNILISLEKPTWLIAIANFLVFLHVMGSYQIQARSVFDIIEPVLAKKLKRDDLSFTQQLITRNLYIALTMFISICFPFLYGLLGLIGGLAFAPTSYFLPCILWLDIRKPEKWSLSWITNWICIVLGVALMVVTPIAGLRRIIVQAKTYEFLLMVKALIRFRRRMRLTRDVNYV
ncbi:hypothetical protein L2E82_44479 [Cichorium intybus]|uniref:Uncharacterized protein n=1 Tax=Cichorium intybus TaxID=13427 RepID=A0ACB8ZRM8_CICIN|nr:hypothetical protein L2E82_44479 [Cichorium intybus]